MYRIVRIQPGQEIPAGRRESPERLERLKTYLAQECLGADGQYYKNPERFQEDHRVGGYDDEYSDEPEKVIADFELMVLVWDPPPEENEFGRVCP